MANAKVTEHDPEGEPPQDAGSGAQAGDPIEELRNDLNKLDQRLTKRINDTNTALTNAVGEMTKKVDGAVQTVNTLKTKVENNESSIASFQGSIDTLNRELPKVRSSVENLTNRLDNVENWQSAFNTAFVQGIQQAKDFALEQGNDAKDHADQVAGQVQSNLDSAKAEVDERITAVENAPVKPHIHTVNLSGQTGGVQQGGK